MRLYVHMVFCGSICTMMYILCNSILPYELPLKWKRRLLRVNIVFYLFPVPWMVAEIKGAVKWLLEKVGADFSRNRGLDIFYSSYMWKSLIIKNQDGTVVHVVGYEKQGKIIIFVFILCFIALLVWILLYIGISWLCKRNMVFWDAGRHYVEDKNTDKKVVVGISPCVLSPMTVGVIKPAILLPIDYAEYEEAIEEVILHELNHVSDKDIVVRFFCFMVVILHLFNPFAYYLFRENVVISEIMSDEVALKDSTKKQKAAYMRCIVNASQQIGSSRTIITTLGVSKSMLRRRMEWIMGANEKKVWKKGVAGAVIIGCVLMSSIPALAYQEPQTYTQIVQSIGGIFNEYEENSICFGCYHFD